MERYEWDSINLFNGNLTLTIPVGQKYPLSRDFGYQLLLNYNSNIWDFEQPSNVITALPDRYANAGLGWDISLGRLIPPTVNAAQAGKWIYITPDGAPHAFYSTLHYDVSDNDPGNSVLYTRDSTYYRLKLIDPATTTVESPDGTINTFKLINGDWLLTKIADRFTNYVSISYATANVWTLTDNHGRTQTIYFKSDPSGYYTRVVDRVVVSAFADSTTTFTFAYSVLNVSRPALDNDPATAATVNIPALTSITAPDGSTYSFTYSTGSAAESSGRLAGMQLPTRGRIEWAYQRYSFASDACANGLPLIYRANSGIATRRMIDTAGNVIGSWSYTQNLLTSKEEKECSQPSEMTNTVMTPLGDKTVYYFSVNTKDHGLPFTKSQTDSSGTRYLSRQVFDCGQECRLLQSSYVRYEQDETIDPAEAIVADVNRREISQRIVYHDDIENGVARFADTDRSDFDGLGHYRHVMTNGNFGSSDVREINLSYDAAVGNYPSTSYSMPAPSAAWITGTVSRQKITEGQSAEVAEFCYDRNTGFLRRVRRWWSANPVGTASAKDVITVYTPDAAGQVAIEQYYGGDIQAVATGSLCSVALPSSDQYQIRHTYQYGVISSSQYSLSTGEMFGSKYVDQDIDRNTGLAGTVSDGAGIAIRYEYDSMGHLAWSKPSAGHGGWMQYQYSLATPTQSATVAIAEFTNGGATALTYRVITLDAFSRIYSEQIAMPDQVRSSRYTHYNAMDWITHQSEFSTEDAKYTQYLDYDPFGRVGIVRPPEGSQHDIAYQYAGVRSVTRTAQVGTWYNAATGQVIEMPRSKTAVYDRQGRLWKSIVHPRAPQLGADVVTTNSYDVAGRLIQSTLDGQLIGLRNSYDGRGFLFLIWSAGQNTFYQDFDALGHACKQRPSTTDLTYVYDRAGRVIRVQETNNPSKVWKELVYAESNGFNDWRQGKLWTTKRYNYMPDIPTPYVVSETNTYGGQDGRISRYEIEMVDPWGRQEKFVQTYSYTDLGHIKETGYPNSVVAGSGNMGRDRKVINQYEWGRLTAIEGTLNEKSESWATSIRYHGNGLLNQVVRANGVTDNVTKDVNDFVRPASVFTTGVKSLYPQINDNLNSGDFQYDGDGNAVRIGSQYFLPQEGSQPLPSPTPQNYSSPCQNGWADPFGFYYAGVSDGSCFPLVRYFYSAGDRLVKTENRVSNTRTWFLYSPSGQKLTEYTRVNTTGSWISTRDSIYRDNMLFGIAETVPASPQPKLLHLTVGFGAQGIVTNQSGYRVQSIH